MSGAVLRLDPPWSGARLRGSVARALGRAAAAADGPVPGSLVGVEHEYRVLGPDGRRVDFRALLPSLAVDGRAVDPGDRHAIRLAWGAALTADGPEAEVALPPLATGPGVATRAAALAARARAELEGLLPAGYRLEGYSTHLSVAMPTALADSVARRYAGTFAAGLMLLLDGPDAPGLLVRPRPGRLELGGDYLAGEGLVAALLYALGSARAMAGEAAGDGLADERVAADGAAGRVPGTVARALAAGTRGARPGRGTAGLPPRLRVTPEPAVERYGWYVDRRAFGPDLYAAGRSAALPLAGGGVRAAGDHLRGAWEAARGALRGLATPDELRAVDALVAGRRVLPLEAAATGAAPATDHRGTADPAWRAPDGRLLDDIRRPGFTLRCTLATWELAVFEVRGPRLAAVSVPRAELGAFLAAAATGLLDRRLARVLATPSRGDVLRSREQALAGTRAWDGIGDPRALLADEPDGHDAPAPAIGVARAAGRRAAAAAGIAGAAVRTGLAAGRLAGLDLDGLPEDGRPGKGRRRHDRRREERRDDGPRRDTNRPEARSSGSSNAAAAAPAAPAAALPLLPLLAVGAVVVVVAAVVLSGALRAGAASTPAPSAAVVAPSSAAPSPSASAIAVAPSVSAAPTEPPLADARIEGHFTGDGGSYDLTITPACETGPCDGSAVVLSQPFEAGGPRGTISMAFARSGDAYGGTGSTEIPFCRAADGTLLTASPAYTVSDVRATAQALVDGRWIATAISGTLTVGAATATGPDGTTCTSSTAPQPMELARDGAAPSPAPTAAATAMAPSVDPQLAEARFDGAYRMTPGVSIMTIAAGCPTGACDVTATFTYWMDAGTKVRSSGTLAYNGRSWTGDVTFKGLRCTNGATANVTFGFVKLVPKKQQLSSGQWVATRLEGTVIRRKFKQVSGSGCYGDNNSQKVVLTLRP